MIKHGSESPLKLCLASAEDLIPRHTQKNVLISACELRATSSSHMSSKNVTPKALNPKHP